MTLMTKPSIAGMLGAVLLLGAVGCSEEPGLYLGGPPGPAVKLATSLGKLTVLVGDSVRLGARAEDEAGNVTGDVPSFTSCDGAVVAVGSAVAEAEDPSFTASAWLRGAGLGVTCVVVQAAGLTDTARITTGPAGVVITGPDTLGSGNAGTYVVEAVDKDGNPLTGTTTYAWSTSNVARMAIVAETGVASGRGTGTVNVQVFAPGGANALKRIVVVAGAFGGTLSATSAAPGALITVTRAPDAPKWDADQGARLRTTNAYIDNVTPDVFTFAVPATGVTTLDTLALLNIGPAQLAQIAEFTATKASEDVYSPGNISSDCTVPAAVPTWSTIKSVTDRVYMVHNGTTQGGTGCVNGGAGYDHWFLYTTGAVDDTVDILADWTLAGDNDIYVYSTDFSSNPCSGFSSETTNELDCAGTPLAANTSYFIIFSPWTANAGNNNVRLTIR